MNWKDYSKLAGKHSVLSASNPSWLNYEDEEQIFEKWSSEYKKEIGTHLHELAAKHIKHRVKMSRTDKHEVKLYLLDRGIPEELIDTDLILDNMVPYVNDSIGFRMQSEQVLYFSEFAFGTADAISFRNNELRIHDLKTGSGKVHMEQLETYAAYFCLDYGIKPGNIYMNLRLYHNGTVIEAEPDAGIILPIMDQIIRFSKYLSDLKER